MLILNKLRSTFSVLLQMLTVLLTLSTHSSAQDKLNVLFIGADDLNCSLGCYGNPDVITPNIDRLAAKGSLFSRAYCQQAVCNPSRASLMTGLAPDTIQVWDLRTDFRTVVPEVLTLPQLFRENGYFTRGIGKMFHNMGDLDDEVSWTVPAVFHAGRHSDTYVLTPPDWKPGQKKGAYERGDLPDTAYRDGKIAELACQQLREMDGKPFFLAVGFWRPHLPFLAPKKYWDLYDRSQLKLPKRFAAPVAVPSIALHDSRELKGYGPDPNSLADEERRELWHGYYASISYLDAQIGKLLRTLEETGLNKNTIVVFWSDHGFHLGQHSLWCKTSCFELDARVPLIISAPGFPEGKQSDSLVELLDLKPTLAELAHLNLDMGHGRSLVPVLKESSAVTRDAVLTQHPRPAYYKGQPEVMGYSLRTDHFRYTEWRDWKSQQVVAEELYAHRHDPTEMFNAVDQKKYRQDVQALKTKLDQLVQERKKRPEIRASE